MAMTIVVARGGNQIDMRRSNAGTHDPGRLQLVPDAQAAKRLLQRLERQTGVEQRAEHHVARRAREAIEVHHPCHTPHPDSFIEQ